MDNKSFNDLGFHPEGGFTFDDLYTPSNDTTEEQYSKAAEDVQAEKDRMHKEVYGDLPNAEDLFGGSSEPAKPEEPEKVEEVAEIVPEVAAEPAIEEPAEEVAPEAEPVEQAPVYTEPVTISYGSDVVMPQEPDYQTVEETEDTSFDSVEEVAEDNSEADTFVDNFGMDEEPSLDAIDEPETFADEEIETPVGEEAEVEETESNDFVDDLGAESEAEPVSEPAFEPVSDPAIDKILPDAYPINENREEAVEEAAPAESGEPVFDIFTPHTEEPNFDGLDEFSRSLLMGAGVAPAAPAAPAPEPVPEPAPAEPMGFDSLESTESTESVDSLDNVEDTFTSDEAIEENDSTEEDTFVDNFGMEDEAEKVEEVEPEEETTDSSIDEFDSPISIADPVVPVEPIAPIVDDIELPGADEVVEEEAEEEEPAEEEIDAAPVISVEGLHKDNVKKLNRAFAEFKEDMLRKDMESIFYGANEIMSKEAILYTYMGNEYTENQEKAIADIDGYRFLNDVYEKSVEIRHDSEAKGEKQEFPETIKAALVSVVGTNEYLYNIRNGAEI